MSRNAVAVSIGAMCILLGTSAMVSSTEQMQIIRITGLVLSLLGMILCLISYKLARDDDYRDINRKLLEMNSTEKMLSELKAMNKNISELVEEIRKDKK